MAGIRNAVLLIAVITLTLHINDARGWIFAACMLVVTAVMAVKLRQPIFGADFLAALLLFRALQTLPSFPTIETEPDLVWLHLHPFTVPIFILSLALETAKRRHATLLSAPSAAVALAAMIVGRSPLGHSYTSLHESSIPVIGAIGALFICQTMLSHIKEEKRALPFVVVMVGWLIGSLWPLISIDPYYAVCRFLTPIMPSFALPAMAGVAFVEAMARPYESASSEKRC
jgi:hypothetical protein